MGDIARGTRDYESIQTTAYQPGYHSRARLVCDILSICFVSLSSCFKFFSNSAARVKRCHCYCFVIGCARQEIFVFCKMFLASCISTAYDAHSHLDFGRSCCFKVFLGARKRYVICMVTWFGGNMG